MALSLLITLSLISLIGGTSIQRHFPNGDFVVYEKNANDQAASYSTMTHPTDPSVKVIITKVTDGRETLVKTVYDPNGRMLDCDVEVNDEKAGQFMNEMELETQSSKAPTAQKVVLDESFKPVADLKMDVQDQASRCEIFIQGKMEENGQPKRVPVDLEEEEGDEEPQEKRRQKRAYLIWPGTNWCGKGSKAEFAQSYGEHQEADQCCQKHDQCPYIIEGFKTRYNLFNYRIHTLSICDCDETFMTCLKSANTSTAAMVAKVYFNVVNTECFDLKLQKTCAKRSWWGGCEKYTTKWTATVRSLGNFPEEK